MVVKYYDETHCGNGEQGQLVGWSCSFKWGAVNEVLATKVISEQRLGGSRGPYIIVIFYFLKLKYS